MRAPSEVLLLLAASAGCSARAEPQPDTTKADAGFQLRQVDATFPATLDAGAPRTLDAGAPRTRDASPSPVDATSCTVGPAALDAAFDGAFITQLVCFEEGTCAGYGADDVLGLVSGPPIGGGAMVGSTDVVSLGGGGSITVGFAPNAIVDGPGIDFVVFENPFDYDNGQRYIEPGEVSVSDDGVQWTVFPCADTRGGYDTDDEPDGGWSATHCGGMNLVYSSPASGISPFDLEHAGGDPFDLAWIGVKHANYVRIRNVVVEPCPEAGVKPNKNGFDLDAIAIIHTALR